MECRRLSARVSYEGSMKEYDFQSVLTGLAPARLRFTRFPRGRQNRGDGRDAERSLTILGLVSAVDFFR
jgi:hypothetical protein